MFAKLRWEWDETRWEVLVLFVYVFIHLYIYVEQRWQSNQTRLQTSAGEFLLQNEQGAGTGADVEDWSAQQRIHLLLGFSGQIWIQRDWREFGRNRAESVVVCMFVFWFLLKLNCFLRPSKIIKLRHRMTDYVLKITRKWSVLVDKRIDCTFWLVLMWHDVLCCHPCFA